MESHFYNTVIRTVNNANNIFQPVLFAKGIFENSPKIVGHPILIQRIWMILTFPKLSPYHFNWHIPGQHMNKAI
jgi:hypothetical protein